MHFSTGIFLTDRTVPSAVLRFKTDTCLASSKFCISLGAVKRTPPFLKATAPPFVGQEQCILPKERQINPSQKVLLKDRVTFQRPCIRLSQSYLCNKQESCRIAASKTVSLQDKLIFSQCWGMGGWKCWGRDVGHCELRVAKPFTLQKRVSSILAWHQGTGTTVGHAWTHPAPRRERDAGVAMPPVPAALGSAHTSGNGNCPVLWHFEMSV